MKTIEQINKRLDEIGKELKQLLSESLENLEWVLEQQNKRCKKISKGV